MGVFSPAQWAASPRRGAESVAACSQHCCWASDALRALSMMLHCLPQDPTCSKGPYIPSLGDVLLQHTAGPALPAAITQTLGRDLSEAQAEKIPRSIFLSAKMGNHCTSFHFSEKHHQHFFLLLKGSHQPEELPPSPTNRILIYRKLWFCGVF